MTVPLFDTIAVIGLGWIGSSVIRGVKARRVARRLVASDISEDLLARVSNLGFCDVVATMPRASVAGAELVVVAVPVGAIATAIEAVAPSLMEGAIGTEVGSVKAAVIRNVLDVRRRCWRCSAVSPRILPPCSA
jgi:cyclohexadieny/prephenate dehydrogenase